MHRFSNIRLEVHILPMDSLDILANHQHLRTEIILKLVISIGVLVHNYVNKT